MKLLSALVTFVAITRVVNAGNQIPASRSDHHLAESTTETLSQERPVKRGPHNEPNQITTNAGLKPVPEGGLSNIPNWLINGWVKHKRKRLNAKMEVLEKQLRDVEDRLMAIDNEMNRYSAELAEAWNRHKESYKSKRDLILA
ncbi:hypothetical protein P152DRAFT_451933 [Eremomyces bilateralis CBS 781.70]|uniref:Uncharacterized protein n=1 Tax=Eremomyces bilateralis CBS 781.70 TaxID=1392243 RepID=A0A6G1FUV5_9PEZI|nr:uncharacterized protein P152DRAFT_451933 [Eremomyces bilateralis CBS 781.70]KAF1809488.1 hypothetical protein P152DRAFT_451933 [Eremomyces bilateralis CBS 781.70]